MELLSMSISEVDALASLYVFAQVLLVNIIMSCDNAIMLSATTQTLKKKQRHKAILFGVIVAAILKISFAFALAQVLEVPIFKIVGGVLLFVIAARLYKQFRDKDVRDRQHTSGKHLRHALRLIIITDMSMSIDNILTLVSAAEWNPLILGIWIFVSIILTSALATNINKLLDRYPRIQRVGFILIIFLSFKMLLAGIDIVIPRTVRTTLLGVGGLVACLVVIYLHSHHLSEFEEEEVMPYLYNHAPFLITFLLLVIALWLLFGRTIHDRLDVHPSVLYTLFVCVFLLWLEMASMEKVKRKHKQLK